MSKLVGILGLGIFGSTIAKTLAEYECDVIAVDINEENVNRLEPFITKGVIGDITNLSLLESIGLDECDIVVIATGTKLEASVLALMNCKRLGIKHIIAKAKNKNYRDVLTEIGAHTVILPEKEAGTRVAKNILRTNIEDLVHLDENTSVVEFYAPQKWVGKNLQELDLRKKYDINIIGIRSDRKKPLNISFTADYVVEKDTILVGLTESETFERYDYLNLLN